MLLPNIPCLTNPTHSLNTHSFHPPPSDQPALPLYIPACLTNPAHRFHPPSLEKPLRIQIEGPLLALQKLLPEVSWQIPLSGVYRADATFPLAGGPELAALAFRTVYHRDGRADVDGDMVVRDEYRGWLREARPLLYVGDFPIIFSFFTWPTVLTRPCIIQYD